jgi:hypothetical protein
VVADWGASCDAAGDVDRGDRESDDWRWEMVLNVSHRRSMAGHSYYGVVVQERFYLSKHRRQFAWQIQRPGDP